MTAASAASATEYSFILWVMYFFISVDWLEWEQCNFKVDKINLDKVATIFLPKLQDQIIKAISRH